MERLGPDAFDGQRLRRAGAWIVDFSADWCPFCQDFLPKFQALEGRGPFRIAVGDLTDPATPLWDRFGLEVTPSLIAFVDGEIVFRVDGRYGVGLSTRDTEAARAALLGRTAPSRPSNGPPR